MNNLVGNSIGFAHLIAGILAVLFGGLVIVLKKGTKIHRQIGYLYVISMIVLIVSSFGIYRLFGKFGLFHFFSIIATFSLLTGMIPMLKKQRTAKDYRAHFTRMYFSVVGLYAAFAAESFIRIPQLGSFWVVVLSMIVFFKKHEEWKNKFARETTPKK